MKINFDTIHVFNWDNLYYIELENEVGIEAFKKLCDNQEASLLVESRNHQVQNRLPFDFFRMFVC